MYNGPFRWWVQSVMPLVFDDSLSYYEVLAKLTKYIEGLTGDVDQIEKILETIEGIEDVTQFIEYLEKIQSEIGDLANLGTDSKTNLVSAINELALKASIAYYKKPGGIPESDLSQEVQDKLNKTGEATEYIINNKTLKAAPSNNSPADLGLGTYTVPSGGIPWDTLSQDVQDRINSGSGSGEGGTKDYNELNNKPQINGHTLNAGNNTGENLGLGTYSKPSTGIPESDLSAEVQEKLNTSGGIADNQESFTASRDYEAGELVYINGVLYKTKYKILTGTTMIPGNNIEVTDISAELEKINSDIEALQSGSGPDSWTLSTNVSNDNYEIPTRFFEYFNAVGGENYLFIVTPSGTDTRDYTIRILRRDGTIVKTVGVDPPQSRAQYRFTFTPGITGEYYCDVIAEYLTFPVDLKVEIEYTESQGISELWSQVNKASQLEPRVDAVETLVSQQQTKLEELNGVAEKVENLETDVDSLNSTTSYKTSSPVNMWHRGYWASATGNCSNTGVKYMRTNQSVNSNILKIECSSDYKMYLLAYNNHTYAGEWDGTQFRVPGVAADATTYYDLQAIRAKNPGYILRITVIRADNDNLDIADASSNIWVTQSIPDGNKAQIDIISGDITDEKLWENGSITSAGNKDYTASNFNKRLSPINFLRFVTPTVIIPKQGFVFSVTVYNLDGTFIAVSDEWNDVPYVFSNPNKLYRINIRPEPDAIELYPSEIASYIESHPYYVTTFESNVASNMLVKVAAHRGYSKIAPENTIPAFRIASEYGFRYVEFDVQYTKDNVPVILHDRTINRTARNLDGTEIAETIYIKNVNYDELTNYDFGIWKGAQFAGTKIPTLSEALHCCKVYNLHPYIELKAEHAYTVSDVTEIINIVRQNGMEENVTFISNSLPTLTEVKNQWDSVELGYAGTVADAETLRTGKNRVFMSFKYNADFSEAVAAGFQIELWDADKLSSIRAINGNGFDLIITTALLPSQINAILIDRFNNSIT